MASVTLLDRRRFALAVAGQRIPAQARASLGEVQRLLEQCEALLRDAEHEAVSLRDEAREEGQRLGREAAAAEQAEQLILAQSEARAFVERSETRIVELAMAVVQRIAPRVAAERWLPDLALAAARAAQAERYLRVRVHPGMVETVRAHLDELREAQPGLDGLTIVADASLDLLDCVAESELGSVHSGFQAQLGRLEASLHEAAGEQRR